MLSYLLQGMSLGLYAGILPGPTQAFILSKTITNGWKRSLSLALVPLVSDLPIALLFCLLIAALPGGFISGIQIVGGSYLIFLGWRTWNVSSEALSAQTAIDPPSGFWQTVGVNLGNPNVYLFWGTIGAPIVLSGWVEHPSHGLAFIIGMYSILVLVTAGTILLFGLTGKLPGEIKGWIMKILAVVVVGFGLYQASRGMSAIF